MSHTEYLSHMAFAIVSRKSVERRVSSGEIEWPKYCGGFGRTLFCCNSEADTESSRSSGSCTRMKLHMEDTEGKNDMILCRDAVFCSSSEKWKTSLHNSKYTFYDIMCLRVTKVVKFFVCLGPLLRMNNNNKSQKPVNIPMRCSTPLLQVITDSMVWNEESVTAWEPSVGQIKLSWWDSKAMFVCIFENSTVSCTTFPPNKKIL